MRYNFIILLIFTLLGLGSCIKDVEGPEILKSSEKELHFSGKGGYWLLTVNSNAIWNIEGTTDWCKVDRSSGSNTGNIKIEVGPNHSKSAREACLQITSDRNLLSIRVSQDTVSGNFHYRLPVVFHVIHDGDNDSIQDVSSRTVSTLVGACNRLYSNSTNSVDMDLELVLAEKDPEGKQLEETGINRILRTTSALQSSSKFFSETNVKDKDILWNPNEYINIYVFTFTEKNTLGISLLPLTPRQNSLEGLEANNYFFTNMPQMPWGLALNNTYLQEDDAYKTLAHELGHYLGLFHVFSEKDCTSDSDFCKDTPNYNRSEYEAWLKENRGKMTFGQLCQRKGCDGQTFTSYNVMDYEVSYQDRFTADQYARIRHVLENSPLIPGPKSITVTKSEDVKPVIRTAR